jgi:hypothetical protein
MAYSAPSGNVELWVSYPESILSLMDDARVLGDAAVAGFELVERACGDRWVHGWVKRDDERWPCFLTRAEALGWMADRVRRIAVFA